MTRFFKRFFVHIGPAAVNFGTNKWLGYASGNIPTSKYRNTPEQAMKDASKLEKQLNSSNLR